MTIDAERRVLSAIDESFDRAIDDIRDAIRIPGVSKSGERLEEMANFVADYLRSLGADVSLHPGKVAPIVEGELRSPGAAYTLLFYTLYDVQPADPDEWTSPPFSAEIVNDEQGQRRLIGRGAFNSKGPLIGFFAVVRAFQDAGVALPVNIHFLIEGEEEIAARRSNRTSARTSIASGVATARFFHTSAPTPKVRRRSASASRDWASSNFRLPAAPGAGRRNTMSMRCIRAGLRAPAGS